MAYEPGEPTIDVDAVRRNLVATTVKKISAGKVSSVSVPHRGLSDEDASLIAQAIGSKQCRLKTLRLTDNDISDAGATALAGAARGSTILTALHLSGNRIGTLGRHALLDVLGTSGQYLQKLELGTLADGQVMNFGCMGLWVNECRRNIPQQLAYKMHTYNNYWDKQTGEHLRVIKMMPVPAPWSPHEDADYLDDEADGDIVSVKIEEDHDFGVGLLMVGDRVRVREDVENPQHGEG